MPVSLVDDKVWFDEPTKLQQICNEANACRANGAGVLLLSHFDATLSRLSAFSARERDQPRAILFFESI